MFTSSSQAVKNITGISLFSLISLQKSYPFPSGSITSNIIICGFKKETTYNVFKIDFIFHSFNIKHLILEINSKSNAIFHCCDYDTGYKVLRNINQDRDNIKYCQVDNLTYFYNKYDKN